MIAGVTGRLIASAFLETRTAEALVPSHAGTSVNAALRQAVESCGPASPLRTILQAGAVPLMRALGFESCTDVREHPFGATATLMGQGGSIPLLITTYASRFDPLWPHSIVCARECGCGWAILYNAVALRLVDAGRPELRRHIEFDLDLAATAAGVAALWLTLAERSLCGSGARSTRALVDQADMHSAAVCRSLREGVLDASTEVLDALLRARRRRGDGSLHDSFEQALTIVYRLLFLLFAEARALVPLWHPVYRQSYSIDVLRTAAEAAGRTRGLWEALRAIARLAHSGCNAGDLRVTPFNGRLFAPSRTPLAERADLDDEKARRALLALSTRSGGAGAVRERIVYRDLGVEQLGAVYETLLDYEPIADGASVTLRPESGARKATGTFYTPQPIADYVVRRTLAPLVEGRTPAEILRLRIVDPSMGSGAFLVAACRYLADAYETAALAAGDWQPEEIDEAERTLIRRRIAERCLYGVDVNPMAVQLARLSMWLATLAADRPLSFLDHRLTVGDSLAGTWLTLLRRPPRAHNRRDRLEPTLFDAASARDALRDALPVRFALESTPNDTLSQVRAKEHAHAALCRAGALTRWKQAADAWCAPWFCEGIPPRAFTAVIDTLLHASDTLPRHLADRYVASAADTARAHRFFHWELEYPEVFFDAGGTRLDNPGFDAVIGNPPWNIVHADAASLLRFVRTSGVYRVPGDGHANRYQLFAERALALTRAGGRIGLVLPWGFAADHGSAALRRHLLDRADVDALVAVDNHRGVFPIHRSVRFVLATATVGRSTGTIGCTFGIDDTSALQANGESGGPRHAVQMTPALLERLSGPSLAVPYVRTPMDLAIAERAAALFPSLADPRGWDASFGRELNATEDRALFRSGRRGWPVVEGKHLSPFRAALDTVERSVAPGDARRALPDGRCERPRLAYRDVASATNRVTLIAAILPPRCVSTHTLFCLRTPLPAAAQRFLCGMFNSLVVNFLVRLRVTTHVTTAIVEQLPIPTWDTAPEAAAAIAALTRTLSRSHRVEPFARLNALAARLYQLTEEEFRRVLETFPLIESSERSRAFEIFRSLSARR